jgi:hypothetical protein
MVITKFFKPCKSELVNGSLKQNTPSKACVIIPLVVTLCVFWFLIETVRNTTKRWDEEDRQARKAMKAGPVVPGMHWYTSDPDQDYPGLDRPETPIEPIEPIFNPYKLLVAVTLPGLIAFSLFWGYCRTCRAREGVAYASIILVVAYTALIISLLLGLLTGRTWLM